MNVLFVFDPFKEQITLKKGLGSTNNPSITDYSQQALDDGVNVDSIEEVVAFVSAKITNEKINTTQIVEAYAAQWQSIAPEVEKRMTSLFPSYTFPPITAYLTLGTRCPYNTEENFFFVSATKKSPIRTCIHELLHFPTHLTLESQFQNNADFNDFKESLTVLLNLEFVDLIEKPDLGYPQHKTLRDWITQDWIHGMSVKELTEKYQKYILMV